MFASAVVGTTNNGLLPLQSLPLQMMNLNFNMGTGNNTNNGNTAQPPAVQNGNQHVLFSNSYSPSPAINPSQELLQSSTRKEELMDVETTEIPLSFMQAFNYVGMCQNSLQAGCLQIHLQIQEMNKEKAAMSMEIDRLNNKCSELEKEKNDLENLLDVERKESSKKQEELDDCKIKLDEMRKEAKLQEINLEKEKANGTAKDGIIEELEKNKVEIESKLQVTDNELQEAKDINRKIVDEYFDSITKPTTLNRLLSEQLAKNQPSPHFQLSAAAALLANTFPAQHQPQEKKSTGAATSKGTAVTSKSKKRKHDNE